MNVTRLKQNVKNYFVCRENQQQRITPCRRRSIWYIMKIKQKQKQKHAWVL